MTAPVSKWHQHLSGTNPENETFKHTERAEAVKPISTQLQLCGAGDIGLPKLDPKIMSGCKVKVGCHRMSQGIRYTFQTIQAWRLGSLFQVNCGSTKLSSTTADRQEAKTVANIYTFLSKLIANKLPQQHLERKWGMATDGTAKMLRASQPVMFSSDTPLQQNTTLRTIKKTSSNLKLGISYLLQDINMFDQLRYFTRFLSWFFSFWFLGLQFLTFSLGRSQIPQLQKSFLRLLSHIADRMVGT